MRWLERLIYILHRPASGPGGQSDLGMSSSDDVAGLEPLYREWLTMPYPKDYPPGGGDVDGVDLAQLDGELGELFDLQFGQGLEDVDRKRLEGSRMELERVVPQLRGDGRPYFAAALAIARWILDGSPTGGPSGR